MLRNKGYAPTRRFSPGCGNWPLEIQPQLGKIIKTEQIGLQVTENFLLFPRKSVTAIIGLMPGDQCLTTNAVVALAHKRLPIKNFQKSSSYKTKETSKTTAETSGIA